MHSPVRDPAVELARLLLGRPSFLVGWGGRPRLISAAEGPLRRAASVAAVPSYRLRAKLWRKLVAVKTALFAPDWITTAAVGDWLPDSLVHLVPVDAIIGTPGPFQSVLIRLRNPRNGSVEAIAKVSVAMSSDALARLSVEAEAMRDVVVDAIVPAILGTGSAEGHPFLVMQFVSGRPFGASRSDFVRAHGALSYQVSRVRTVVASEHPWLDVVRERLPELDLDRLPSRLGVARTHGDYAPWNVIWTPSGRPVVIDWEASDSSGVQFSDLAHYALAVERYLRGRSPAIAAGRAMQALSQTLSLSERDARLLVGLAAVVAVLRDAPHPEVSGIDRYWRDVVGIAFGSALVR